jgi:two-component system LytT family response regulator
MSLRVLIVDDEAPARWRIRRLVSSERDLVVAGECSDGAAAVLAIISMRPELVFLDVQMPELDGFEVVRQLDPAALPAVVFVTAFDQYAIRAFDVHAIDYLLKPFSRQRFQLALARARERIQARRSDAGLASLIESLRDRPRYLSRVSVRSNGRIVLVDLRTVDWIEAADNYVRLHAGPREHIMRETLAALERQLDPEVFARIHRSTIVRIDRILELHPASHGDMDVVLRDGTTLTLSRTWRDRVQRLFGRPGEF